MFNNVLFFLSFLATFVSFHLSDTSWVRFSVSKETSFEVPVVDVDAQQMFEGIRHCQVKPTRKENDKAIITSFLKYNHTYSRIYRAPIVLLHGFDSSCLEFRRLTPFLQSSIDDREIYIPDILGWGFGNYSEVLDFSPDAKLDHMQSFIKQIVRRPCILVGASLGGGIAVKMGTSKDFSQFVEKICLIDAQAFIDGVGPNKLPLAIIRPLVRLLKSKPLRWAANFLSYRDKRTFATEDALRVGSAHCSNPDWERASINFVQSGGFVFGDCVSRIKQKTLLIWGRNDQILDPKVYPAMFQRDVEPGLLSTYWVEECGHVPHLEKPAEVAAAIAQFLKE